MNGSLEPRLVELEMCLTHQQRLIEQLNEALVGQQRQLDQVTAELQQLLAVVRAEPWRAEAPPANVPPPHY